MPAVFVHGVPDTASLWDPLRASLTRTDTVALSLPGFGVPLPDGFDATKEAYAGWIIEQLEAIGQPVDLVGHDWGSLLVQRVASTRPELIRTWAAGSANVDAEYEWHPVAQIWQTPGAGEEMIHGMVSAGRDDKVLMMTGAGVPADLAERQAEHLDARMGACILALYRSAVTVGAEWQPAIDALGDARPALVLWGADDPLGDQRFAERLAARVGGGLEVFDGCGHWWPSERPAEAAGVLEELWA